MTTDQAKQYLTSKFAQMDAAYAQGMNDITALGKKAQQTIEQNMQQREQSSADKLLNNM